MKFKYIISILLVTGMMSCSEDFTDLVPISQRNAGNFYNSASDMGVAVNAIYNTLKASGTYNQSYWVMQELRSDNTLWDGTGLAEEVTVFDKFTDISTSTITEAAWNDSYLGISRANIVLNRIAPIAMDAGLKNQYIGEALFLRSLYYYHLAVAFGNIPLVLTETVSVAEGLQHVQVNAATVYTRLVADLTTAEANLPQSYGSADQGRATKGAAATLLARVQLTAGDKGGAQTTLTRVMGYGYSLVPDYNNLWGVDNEYNSESIFEVDFEGGLVNQGNNFTSAFNGDLSGGVTSGLRNVPEQDLLDEYESGDERFAASIDGIAPPGTGWTVKYGRTNAFADDDGPNNWVVFRYADVLLMMAEALGEGTAAYGHINTVRDRAGLGPIDGNTPGTFAEKLLHERRVELAFENHRWADLLRFGVADQVMAAQGKPTGGKLLFLIPQRELDLNPSFDQN